MDDAIEIDTMDRARELLDRHHPAAALSILDRMLASGEPAVPERAARVHALWMLRRAAEARVELAALLATAPGEACVQVVRGIVALGLRDDPALLDCYSAAAETDLDLAAEAFELARRLDPTSIEAVRGHATVLRLRRDYTSAREVLGEAMDSLGTHAALLIERATMAVEQWELAEARSDLEAAIDADPDSLEAHLALIMLINDNFSGSFTALDRLEVVRTRFGGAASPEIDEALGWVLIASLDFRVDKAERAETRKRAREAFERTLESHPGHIGARSGLIWIKRDTDGPSAALSLTSDAFADAPRSPQLLMSHAWLALEIGDNAAAVAYHDAARQEAPYLVRARAGVVLAASVQGDLDYAASIWGQMRRLFPNHPETLRAGSYLAQYQDRPADALDLAEQAVRRCPDHPGMAQQRASALLSVGYYGEASDETDPLADAVERWPGSPYLRWQVMLRSDMEGRVHEALDAARLILLLDPQDTAARESEKNLRRWLRRHPVYRWTGRRLDRDALIGARFSPQRRSDLDRFVAPDRRWETLIRLRSLAWREARLTAADGAYADDHAVWLVLLLILPVLAAPWLGGPMGHGGVWWNIARCALALAVYIGLLITVEMAQPWLKTGVRLVVIGLSAWALSPGEGGLRAVLRAGVVVPALVTLLYWLVGYAWRKLNLLRRRRLRSELAHPVLIGHLLTLLQKVSHSTTRWIEEDRREVATLLDAVAAAQAQILRRTVAAGGTDRALSAYAGHRALGVAAATRDLKQRLVVWDQHTPKVLFRRVNRMLDATCRGEWGRFAYRKPDQLPQRLRGRLWTVTRFAVTVGIVGFGVWLVVLSRQNPNDSAAAVTAVTGLVTAAAPFVVPLVEHLVRGGIGNERQNVADATEARGRLPGH
jgi:tetratricopeptide (TPR) repeat protein